MLPPVIGFPNQYYNYNINNIGNNNNDNNNIHAHNMIKNASYFKGVDFSEKRKL